VISNSTISGNSATVNGGGIENDVVGHNTIVGSTISGNEATVNGGGIYSRFGYNTIVGSTISGNLALRGGGIFNEGSDLTIENSTISGNDALDAGGGIYTDTNLIDTQTTTITGSTISGNAAASGGGLHNYDGLSVIRFSTITDNSAPAGAGSGVLSFGDQQTRTEVHSSIIAGNTNSDVDFTFPSNSFQSNQYNLIGSGNATSEFVELGDQTGIANPMLGPLTDHGGPTMTHALLPGSPAIDAGDPAAVAGVGDVPEFDQRGSPFTRVSGGRIDIGAFEVGATLADFDLDLDVDGFDFLAWQRGLGLTGASATRANGNADGDADVDGDDLAAWKSQFGAAAASATVPAGAGTLAAAQAASAVDALLGSGDFTALFATTESSPRGKRRSWRR
jgi:putative cofactor-binding repeat protein